MLAQLSLTSSRLITLLSTGLPIAFSILAICLGYMLITGMQPDIAGATMFWFLNKLVSWPFPFSILSAEILSRSGATAGFASNVLCGRLPNGLASLLVAIMVFSAISGSSVATAVAIGRVMKATNPKWLQSAFCGRLGSCEWRVGYFNSPEYPFNCLRCSCRNFCWRPLHLSHAPRPYARLNAICFRAIGRRLGKNKKK